MEHLVGLLEAAVLPLSLIFDYLEAGSQRTSQADFELFLQPRHVLTSPPFPQAPVLPGLSYFSGFLLGHRMMKSVFVSISPKSCPVHPPRPRVSEKWSQPPIP